MRHFFAFMVGVGCLGFLDTAHSQTYDLGLDFMDAVVPSVGIGPDGVWSYGFDFSDVNVTNPVAFTPYTLHGGAPAGPDSYYTNGPASIYQSPPAGGFGIISHDPDVANARSIIRWTAPSSQTLYIDGSSSATVASRTFMCARTASRPRSRERPATRR